MARHPQRVENGDQVEEWVPGVRIIVETKHGEIVAEDVTDETGHYVIDRPDSDLRRAIDTDTLPEGLTIAEGEPAAHEVPVRNDSTTTRAFPRKTQAETTAGDVLARGEAGVSDVVITTAPIPLGD